MPLSIASSAARLSLTALIACAAVALPAQKPVYSTEHRDHEHALPQALSGPAKGIDSLAGSRSGVSLVVAHFDSDGTPDVITGYSTGGLGGVLLLQRGNPRAAAPTAAEWEMVARGEFVTPYIAQSEPIAIPVRPDFMRTSDVDGHGHPGIIVAARGDTTLYLLFGRGDGTFAAPRAVPLAGALSALSTWRAPDGQSLTVAAICGSTGCGLQFLDRDGHTRATIPMTSAVTSIETGNIDSGAMADLAVISNGHISIVDGDTALSKRPVVEGLPVAGAAALALGSFVTDSRGLLQIAALSTDSTLHVFTRAGLTNTSAYATGEGQRRSHPALPGSAALKPAVKQTGQPWAEVETIANVGPGGKSPRMLRAHLLGSGNDDLAVLAGTQYITIAHRRSVVNGQHVTTPVVSVDSTSSEVVAAVATRIGADARQSVLLMHAGPQPLTVTPPPTAHTYTVNTATDGNDTLTTSGRCIGGSGQTCTLRDAANLINFDTASNVAAGTIDVILVPAGTYKLTVNNPLKGTTTPEQFDLYGSYNTHLELDGPFSLQGAGIGSTIIDGQQLDQILSINLAAYQAVNADDYRPQDFDAFVSGVTLQSALNRNGVANASCSAQDYCNSYAGAVYWSPNGNTSDNLVFNNVLITSSQDAAYTQGGNGGGGVGASINSNGPGTLSGPLELDNSTVSNNNDRAGDGGGGIQTEYGVPLTLSNVTVSGNVSYGGTNNPGYAGGVAALGGLGSQVTPISITNSTINNNTASAGFAGGLYLTGPVTMSTTVVSNNTGYTFGGGMYLGPFATNITTSNFFGNRLVGTEYVAGDGLPYLQDGAAFCVDAHQTTTASPGSGPVINLSYSRIFNNTGDKGAFAVAGGCNNGNNDGNGNTTYNYDTVNATNDWWGCQTGANTGSCSTARTGNANFGTINLTPFTVLALTTNTPITSGTPINATGGLYTNNSGTTYTPTTQTAGYNGVAASVSITQNGGGASTTNGTLGTSGKYTGSVTANNTGPASASITVDNATVTSNFTVVGGAPDLIVQSAHTGNFKAGDASDVYLLTVSNIGAGPTSAGVTLTDTLPSGFTATAVSGTGWTCASPPTVSCTRFDQLSASVNYPAVTVTVSVSAADIGNYNNVANVSGGGETNTSNDSYTDATLVVAPPAASLAFSPSTVARSVNSTATYTLTNPNTSALVSVGFTDTLPAGLQFTGSASSTCNGGTIVLSNGNATLTVSGTSVPGASSCTVSVSVVSASAGSYATTTSTVTSSNANPSGTASATLNVEGPGTLAEDFTFSPVPPGAASTVKFTIGNPGANPVTLTGIAFSDTLPSGLVVYSTPAATTTCGGSISANAGSGAISFSGGSLAVGATCTVSVQVSAAGAGTYTNTSAALSSSNGGIGTTASATLVVASSRPIEVNSPTVTTGYATLLSANATYQGTTAPSGAVTFMVGGSAANVGPVSCIYKATHSNCTATYTATGLAGGQYTITVAQAADANYVAASGTGTLTVSNTAATSTVVSVSSNSVTHGTAINLTATLISATGTSAGPAPTGTVTFYSTVNGTTTTLATTTITTNGSTGTATTTYAPPVAGSYTITALYNPTASFLPSADTTGQVVSVQ